MADLNTDGRPDLLASLLESNRVVVYHNNGLGGLGDRTTVSDLMQWPGVRQPVLLSAAFV